MRSLYDFFIGFLDSLTGHLALTAYLLAVTDEREIWKRLKKLPLLLLSPLLAALFSTGMYLIPQLREFQYFILSFLILIQCSLWVRLTWGFSFWQAFAATCMAGIFQVADEVLSHMLFQEGSMQFAAAIGLHLGVSVAAALLIYKLRFGKWFRLLLDSGTDLWRTALILFALEVVMEMFLRLANGVEPRLLAFYYLPVAATVLLMASLAVYSAQRLDAAGKYRRSRT